MIGQEGAVGGFRRARRTEMAEQRAGYILAAIVLVGAALRFWHLGHESLWNDEGFSWWWSQQPFATLWGAEAAVETTPPLYYSLQRLWLVFGHSEFALRSLSAVFGTLAIPLVYLVGRTLGGRELGLVTAALLATSAVHVSYSQEARTYALLCDAGLLTVLGLLWFLRAHSDRTLWPDTERDEGRLATPRAGDRAYGRAGLALYALGATTALYSHSTAIFLVALANLAAAAWWLCCTGRDRAYLWSWLAANLVPAIAWLYWLPVAVAQSRGAGTLTWLDQPTATWAAHELLRLYSLRFLPSEPWLDVAAPIYLLGLVGVVVGWRQRPAILLPLAFAAGIPALAYLMGFVGRPVWIERTVFWPLSLGLVLVASGLLAVRPAALRCAVIGLVLVAHAVNLGAYYGTTQKPSMASAAARIADGERPGDGILLVVESNQWPLAYYLSRHGHPLHASSVNPTQDGLPPYPWARVHPMAPPYGQPVEHLAVEGLRGLWTRYERMWVMIRRGEVSDPEGRVMGALLEHGRVVDQQHYAPGLELVLVEFRAVPG